LLKGPGYEYACQKISLLSYDEQRIAYADNLQALYRVSRAPSDTYLRERLDEVDPKSIRPAFK
jgi:hypothetical protein